MGFRLAASLGIRFLIPLTLGFLPGLAAAQGPLGGCQPAWSADFGGSSGLNGAVFALLTFDDGSGPALYAAGAFSSAGGTPANRIAKWNGAQWSGLDNGLGVGSALALAVLDDGAGPALYVGGTFTTAGNGLASRVAKWDGTSWSPLGAGIGPGFVSALVAFDDGSGPALYAGGSFGSAGGASANCIAKWDGANWSALPGVWSSGSPGSVGALVVHDEGHGPRLFAAGSLQNMGAPPSSFVARWDVGLWSLLSSPQDAGETALALASGDLGSGPALYAGGDFITIGGVPAPGIARWDGTSWSAVGTGISNSWDPPVKAIAIFDDGHGSALYAAGAFSAAGGGSASNIARWDGTQWTSLGSGTDAPIFALAPFTLSGDPALFVGGNFGSAGGNASNHLGRWALPPGCAQVALTICEPGQSGTMDCPCSNPPAGLGRGCDNGSATGGASLVASGHASLAHDTLLFTTSGENASATSILMQGTTSVSGGVAFGQGVRCVTGAVKRLCFQAAVGGSISVPPGGSLSISARSALLGDALTAGSRRYYGVYYRDPIVPIGCPVGSTYNVSQQLDVLWHP